MTQLLIKLSFLIGAVCATTTHPTEDTEALATERHESASSDYDIVSTEEAPDMGHANLLRVAEGEKPRPWHSGWSWFGFRNLGQAESLPKILSESRNDGEELETEPKVVQPPNESGTTQGDGSSDDDPRPLVENVSVDAVADGGESVSNASTVAPTASLGTLSVPAYDADQDILEDGNTLRRISDELHRDLRRPVEKNEGDDRWMWAAAIMVLSGIVGMYLNK